MGEELSEGFHKSDMPMSRSDVEGCMPTLREVQEFIMSFFKNWSEGPIGRVGQCCPSLDTLCRDFFPANKYMCSLGIGADIDEKFGLEEFCFTWAMPDHNFHIAAKNLKEAFYKKYPKEKISEQTLKKFTEMVYDLILIKNGFLPS